MIRLRKALAVLLTAFAIITTVVATTGPAWALSLDQARAEGYLGERIDGLLGTVDDNAPAAAVALMRDINAQRLAKYREIAQQNGTSVEAVQKIVGQKQIAKTPPGQWVNPGSGWVRK